MRDAIERMRLERRLTLVFTALALALFAVFHVITPNPAPTPPRVETSR